MTTKWEVQLVTIPLGSKSFQPQAYDNVFYGEWDGNSVDEYQRLSRLAEEGWEPIGFGTEIQGHEHDMQERARGCSWTSAYVVMLRRPLADQSVPNY